MARGKKRKGKSRKGTLSDRYVDVQLVPTVEFLHEHITEALCAEVFRDLRTTERERKWTLFALSRFWQSVILDPPPSLTQLLERTRRGDPEGFLPQVDASAEAFFQKCKNFDSAFFMAVYHRFVSEVTSKAPVEYCGELAHLRKKFSNVSLIDGSRLDRIAHRLKILWPEDGVVLPGCLIAVYDLFRGFATQLWFDDDAAASEHTRALDAIEALPSETLLVGDRLYCTLQMFHALGDDCFGVFRRNKSLSFEKKCRLSRRKTAEGVVEDWLVVAGKGKNSIELRLIILHKGGKATYEAFTDCLDTKRLTAEDIVALYPRRWQVERLFFDLKEVLNLKKFYAANPNAVAMQVYAGAMVHVAFRIAQADISRQADVPPEDLSPKKLFPLLALVSIRLVEAEFIFEATRKANPRVKLRKPSWRNLPDSVVSLRAIRVQRRSETRRKREYSPERAKWKSMKKVKRADE